jgi:hypothetical protein
MATVQFGYSSCPQQNQAQGTCPVGVLSSGGLNVTRVHTSEGWTWFCVSGVPAAATTWMGQTTARQDISQQYTNYWTTGQVSASPLHPSAAQLQAVGCPTSTDLIVSSTQDQTWQQQQETWTIWFN